MVKNLLLLLFFFHIFSCSAQLDFYYLNDWYYKGNPKNVRISTFSIQSDSITGVDQVIQEDEVLVDLYNENNKCISHQWQNLNSDITKEFRFNYDKNGNSTEFVIFGKDSTLKERYLTILDSNQNEVAHEVYDSLNKLISRTTEIKILGDLEETTLKKDSSGAITSKHVSIFDTLGRKIRTLRYSKDLKLINEFFFSYNENDQIVEQLSVREYRDTLVTLYKYDTLGREIELSHYNKASNHCTFSYRTIFRDSLNLKERLEYDNGLLTSSSSNYLDSNDCVVKIVDLQMSHPMRFTQYKKVENHEIETHFLYDDRLNWIVKTVYYDGEKLTIQKREFEYY